jgi:hypothetical protein
MSGSRARTLASDLSCKLAVAPSGGRSTFRLTESLSMGLDFSERGPANGYELS